MSVPKDVPAALVEVNGAARTDLRLLRQRQDDQIVLVVSQPLDDRRAVGLRHVEDCQTAADLARPLLIGMDGGGAGRRIVPVRRHRQDGERHRPDRAGSARP